MRMQSTNVCLANQNSLKVDLQWRQANRKCPVISSQVTKNCSKPLLSQRTGRFLLKLHTFLSNTLINSSRKTNYRLSILMSQMSNAFSPTVNISGQNYNFVNLFKNGFTNLSSLLLDVHDISWIDPIAALDEGSNAGCQSPQQSSRLIAAHAHHEPVIARESASQLIACVTVFNIYKLVCDRHASMCAI